MDTYVNYNWKSVMDLCKDAIDNEVSEGYFKTLGQIHKIEIIYDVGEAPYSIFINNKYMGVASDMGSMYSIIEESL